MEAAALPRQCLHKVSADQATLIGETVASIRPLREQEKARRLYRPAGNHNHLGRDTVFAAVDVSINDGRHPVPVPRLEPRHRGPCLDGTPPGSSGLAQERDVYSPLVRERAAAVAVATVVAAWPAFSQGADSAATAFGAHVSPSLRHPAPPCWLA